jgi:hypothetical protein
MSDADKQTWNEPQGWFRENTLCRFGWCQTFKTKEDETHCWGECMRCGKVAGVVSRVALRRYLDAPTSSTLTEPGTADVPQEG